MDKHKLTTRKEGRSKKIKKQETSNDIFRIFYLYKFSYHNSLVSSNDQKNFKKVGNSLKARCWRVWEFRTFNIYLQSAMA